MYILISLFMVSCTSAAQPTPTPTIPPEPPHEDARIEVYCRFAPGLAGGYGELIVRSTAVPTAAPLGGGQGENIQQSAEDLQCANRLGIGLHDWYIFSVRAIGIGQARYILESTSGDFYVEHDENEIIRVHDANPVIDFVRVEWEYSKENANADGYFTLSGAGTNLDALEDTTTVTITVTGEVRDYVYTGNQWIQQFAFQTITYPEIEIFVTNHPPYGE